MRALTLIPLFFLLGSTLLLILTVINGAGTSSVLGNFYWSETDTSNIPGAGRDKTRWTFYRSCGESGGRNSDCSSSKPAYPYSPKDNFNSEQGIPQSFIDDRNTYYYLSRCGWAFIVVALVFSALALILIPINFCITIGGILTIITSLISFIFAITGAACITAAHVKGKHEFNKAGHSTSLSAKSFGILWAAVACLIIVFATAIGACCGTRKGNKKRSTNNQAYPQDNENNVYSKESGDYAQGNYVDDTTANNRGVTGTGGVAGINDNEPISDASKFRFFRVKRAKPEEI
ncbi:FMP45 [Candida pseudojiufengensis]|uniref:FMP45 n=1 Tax=Candida pseudojiufengensis TaxID=497109 RepID=UPI002224BEBD|nr:FMP45 [Candida pseudojiufengensis]KAI5960752.1 FMP45 [Candida pseudojiufengensis]